jgi:acyl-CoA reductase-like NAD-dependent aldehyde dehydrogenase
MQAFDTEADAVMLANGSDYGLAARIWTGDIARPLRVGRDLQVGTVWVNDRVTLRDEFEEGGYKQSRRGRLRGQAALDDFLEYKHIVLKPGVVARNGRGASPRRRAEFRTDLRHPIGWHDDR